MLSPMAAERHGGGCQCGAVRFTVEGPLRDVLYCHCARCRRSHGGIAAYSACERADLSFASDGDLRWFENPDPTDEARRGFCGRCGSRLFWEHADLTTISVAAGSLDEPSGVRAIGHIFTAHKGDYYDLADDGLPRWNDSLGA